VAGVEEGGELVTGFGVVEVDGAAANHDDDAVTVKGVDDLQPVDADP